MYLCSGCGTWAGVPYGCYAQLGLLCMTAPVDIYVGGLVIGTNLLANSGDIAPVAEMLNDRYKCDDMYLLIGNYDWI